MFRNLRHPVLHLIVCDARAAGDLEPFVKSCQKQGWDVWIVTTPAAVSFIDADVLAELTGNPVRTDDPLPDEPTVLPPAGAVAVVPATFKAMNQLAYGNTDSFALGLVEKAIGLGLPVLAMPTPDAALAQHPVFAESVGRLRGWGVAVIANPTRYPLPGDDAERAAHFPWHAAEELLGQWIRFARVTPLEQAG